MPSADHARPEYLAADGLVVHHYNRFGRVKDYDFSTFPVAEPMQRSLARLFAARCVPHRWTAHGTSNHHWLQLRLFAEFLSRQEPPPSDLDDLTVVLIRRWREHVLKSSGHLGFANVASLLRDDARLQTGPMTDELARRVKRSQSKIQSYTEDEFDRIRLAAKRIFRAALQRIEDNAVHLERWRAGEFPEGNRDWLVGEGLDLLARTGEFPHCVYPGGGKAPLKQYCEAFGDRETRWQRLFLTRYEAVSLGVLLLAEYGWNLSVIDQADVPRALPDPGEDGHPTFRISLEKARRGRGQHYETRNVTDSGAASPGRLITQALRATRFARAVVEQLAPGTGRLVVWRTAHLSRKRVDLDRHPPIGPFSFGVDSTSAREWAQRQGFSGSPFRRGRRTVIALDRREPGQHSQDTHDRDYVLVDKRVQDEAVEVIAAGVEDAVGRARAAVLVAELRDAPTSGDLETATADCSGYGNSPYPSPNGGCGATFLMCLGCSNAHIHPGHHPRLAHLHHALANLRSVLLPAGWEADWAESYARLDDLKRKIGDGVWAQGLASVTETDREIITDLLTGALDA